MSCGVSGFLLTLLLYLFVGFFASPIGRIIEQHAEATDFAARLRRTGRLDGDGQGDLQGHGGEQRAVLAYQAQPYAYWRKVLERDDLEFGRFGENFTVDGPADYEVRIGDRHRIGEAEFEVTQPRVTCYRVGMRLNEPRMASLSSPTTAPASTCASSPRAGSGPATESPGPAPAGGPSPSPTPTPCSIFRTQTRPHCVPPWALRRSAPGAAVLPGDEPPTRPAVRPAPAAPGWKGFKQLRLTQVVPETPTVPSFLLRPPTLRRCRPRQGQHLLHRPGSRDRRGAGNHARAHDQRRDPGARHPCGCARLSVRPRGLHVDGDIRAPAGGLSNSHIHTEVFGAQPLEDPASGEVLPCCSIHTTDVLLDL